MKEESETVSGPWKRKGLEYTLPQLFKRETNDTIRSWQISVIDHSPNGGAAIVTTYGREGGKQQTTTDVIIAGKNIGKRNETTPLEQALAEAHATWTCKQSRKGYATTADAADANYRPMLALQYKNVSVDFWQMAYCQRKYDGFRCLAAWDAMTRTVELRSREGSKFESLPHINRAIGRFCRDNKLPSITFDGELYSHALTFTKIASAIKRQIVDDDDSTAIQLAKLIRYHCYDVVDTHRSFVDRYLESVYKLLPPPTSDDVITHAPTVAVRDAEELMQLQAEYIKDGYEGAILRNGAAVYEHKRSRGLIKVKTFDDDEFIVVSVKAGRGSSAEEAVFGCRTSQGHYFDVLAPGTKAEKRQYLRAVKRWIGRKLTVKFEGYTATETPVPRNPVALRFADLHTSGK